MLTSVALLAPSPHIPPDTASQQSPRDTLKVLTIQPMGRDGSAFFESKAHPESSDDEASHMRSAVSEDESGSPLARRRRKALLSSPSSRFKRPALPDDRNPHANDHGKPTAMSEASISLTELAHLIRSHKEQEKRATCSRVRLHRSLVVHQLSIRLARCGEDARHDLFEAYRSGDKRSFAALHDSLYDLRTTFDASRRYALLDPDMNVIRPSLPRGLNLPDPDATFLHEIPTATRDELLAFLSILRSDPNFLAERVACLSAAEIDSLISFRAAAEGSVLGGSSGRVRRIGSAASVRSGPVQSGADQLLLLQRHDVFSILFHGLFATPSRLGSPEDVRRSEVWSTLCARLITEPKPGGEKLLTCILDEYADLRGWGWKHNLDLFLMQTLRAGQFLVERTEDLFSRGRAVDGILHADLSSKRDAFMYKTCKDLFSLFSDGETPQGLPLGVLEVGFAAYRQLTEEKHRTGLQRFIVHRWFLGRFLPDAISNPEVGGHS